MIKSKYPVNYNSPAIDDLFDDTNENEYRKTEKRMLLATRIDKAKEAKGWTNKELAIALGLKETQISEFLSGTHNFTTNTLSDIEELLNIKLLHL